MTIGKKQNETVCNVQSKGVRCVRVPRALKKAESKTHGVNHAEKAVVALGDDVDDGSTVLAHVAFKGSLVEVECSHEVQVDNYCEPL